MTEHVNAGGTLGGAPDSDSDEQLSGTAAFDAGVGEMPSWSELVQAHADSVYGLAYRLTGNQQDAEDLTQETFMRVFRSLKSYRPGTFEGWLHRITTNLFLDMVRHRQVIRMEALPENYDRVPGTLKTPEQAVEDSMLDPDLEIALSELQPDYRAVVVLCDVVGLTYEEIANTLGIKMGTVRSRIHRARSSLRATLERLERERQEQAEAVTAG
ncbi:MAG: RNA polymerase sigma factor SigE [Corynebacterium sp.]|uniref:RNA polymerase sigma factor SigE n=1 Tax=Corynebacterium sp. TaxID=1720 RepID=UPI0026DCE7E6|nr:RNA polymerase sigma factor SigE [Corynebacterium sp.]MDO5029456.1 RNA polymerase sigma factor SigE [Corynebacterium sp.]